VRGQLRGPPKSHTTGLRSGAAVACTRLDQVWFGQTESAMLFVVVMGTIWSVIIATDHGARNIAPIYARAARTTL